MEHYRRADYRAAVDDLRVAAEMDPEAAHTRFFLGVAHLMLGQDDAGIARLRATIALGDSPYLEDAHFYLAKAFLKRKDLGAAETQLNALIRLPGSKSDEARRLLSGIQTLKERSD
jgi:tetratricopeptide (TPR) repeat protein